MNQSVGNHDASPFLAAAAVEAWDTWFRWRENGQLRDDTVEATWQRVIRALSRAEPEASRHVFEHRLLDSFGNWRLLLDERVLATAGTGTMSWSNDGLVAVLNLSGFTRVRGRSTAFDVAALLDCARLAVRALDNAIVLREGAKRYRKKNLRIGLIGLADVLASLGLDYVSTEARGFAQSIARVLAEGCLREAAVLADERGAAAHGNAQHAEKLRRTEISEDFIHLARCSGLRYDGLTAVTSQPRLAKFANDVSDGIAPPSTLRFKASSVALPAQVELRGAMQPWIDEPIACPIHVNVRPSPASHLDCYARATALGLGTLSWQL